MPQRLNFPGFIPPGFTSSLPKSGTVTENGNVESEDGHTLVPEDDIDLDAGTEVKLVLKNRNVHYKTQEEIEEAKRRQEEKRKQREGERKRKREQKRKEAEEFWDQYDIPIEHGIGYKGRLSEVQRGSSGTGITSQSVRHLYVQESFKEGRLEREEGEFLCGGIGKELSITPDHCQATDRLGCTPKVTCKTCLKRMKRWKKD